MVLGTPNADTEAVSQLAYGEEFAVLDMTGGWAWGYCVHDGYVGYVRHDILGVTHPPSHLVSVREAPVFSCPSIKSTVTRALGLGARVAGTTHEAFLDTGDGFIHLRHLIDVRERLADPVETAEKLIGAPYLWGGRGDGGVDCSGLVQRALALAGLSCPRDSDQQLVALGRELTADEPLTRGDLVFFPGHVGIMADGANLLHANAYWMQVVIEPLADVIARLQPTTETPVLGKRRLAA
jgi:cell wall-associated NlpC family hydrolase